MRKSLCFGAALALCALAGTTFGQVYPSTDTPLPINDNPGASTQSVLTVAGAPASITDLEITINLTHTWDSDIVIVLEHNGMALNLSANNGGSGDNYTATRFVDCASTNINLGLAPFTGNFQPEGGDPGWTGTFVIPGVFLANLAGWSGQDANGVWMLDIDDEVGADAGTLIDWQLKFPADPCAPPPPPPPGDDCTAPFPISGNGSYPTDTTAANTNMPWPCAAGGREIFFEYTPVGTGLVQIDMCGSSYDTALAVGSTCGASDLACNDDFCGLQSGGINVSISAGVPIYIAVGGFASQTGVGVLNITELTGPPPANDSCATPDLVGEGSFPFDNTMAGSTLDGTFTCGFNEFGDLHWQYTPTFTGNALIDTCGSALDTVLTVGTSCGGEDLGCNDQFCGNGSRLVVAVTTGVPVFVNVAGWNGGRGSGVLNIGMAPPAPANDNCLNAEPAVDGTTYPFDTSSATLDGTGSCGASGSSPDVWFDYVPSNTGCATISLCGSGYDTVVEMFDACGGVSMGCNDDFCGLQSTLSVNGVTAGTHYWVRVSGFANQVGTGQITFSSAASTPYSPPGSGTVEPEPCDPFTPDVINAGCNSTPPSYGSISCGETILGTGFWNGSLRDTDWFNFHLDADDTVTFTGQMMFGGVAYGLQVVDCPTGQINFWAIGGNSACGPDFSISAALTAGDYTLFIAPSFAAPLVNCGVNDQYWVTMTTGAGCGGNPCDFADTNCDGALNGFDVQATEEAVNGDFTNFCGPTADLNGDGAENGFDVEYSEQLVNQC